MDESQKMVVNAVKAYLEDHCITQTEAAERLGIAQSSVSTILTQSGFGKNTARKWGKAFGFDPDYLYTGKGNLIKTKTPLSVSSTINNAEYSRLLEIIKSQQDTIESLSSAIVALTNR